MLFSYLTLSHAIAALVCSLSRWVRTTWRTSMGDRRHRHMGGRVRTSTAASVSNVEEVVTYSFSSCHGLGLVVLNFMSWTWTCCVELHEHQVIVWTSSPNK